LWLDPRPHRRYGRPAQPNLNRCWLDQGCVIPAPVGAAFEGNPTANVRMTAGRERAGSNACLDRTCGPADQPSTSSA
jgi:hypothetical protein